MTFDPSKMVALDFETHLIESGRLAPTIVCGSAATQQLGATLLAREAALGYAYSILGANGIIVGANIAFDFGCLAAADPEILPLIFKAYADGRVYDVQIAQALHAIAEGNLYQDPTTGQPLKGRYSLARCVEYVLGRTDAKKNDTWRLRYALLEDVPIEEWPEEARQYPVDDAVNTLEVAVAQVQGGGAGPTPGPHRNIGDLSNQAEAAFALHLGAIWGLRTDPERVEALRRRTEKAHASFVKKFQALGFFDSTGKKDTNAIKRAVIVAYGGGDPCHLCVSGKTLSPKTGDTINCKACSGTGLAIGAAPITPTGGVCADRDALLESGDPDLVALGDNEAEKIRDTYLPALESEAIGRSLRPNVLVASGRTSYDGLIQLLTKDGGVRECHRARPGQVLCSVDYAAGELCTWSQVKLWLFGHSIMADTINATGDPGMLHTAFGASLAGKTTEEMIVALRDAATKVAVKKYRDAAKEANFALGGGMGAPKFVFSARKKNKGATKTPDGLITYPGIRFCILLGGEERCGTEKITQWRDRPTNLPPICKRCVEIASDIRDAWFVQWPEAKQYFAWVAERVGDHGRGELPCFATERVRGGLDFTNGANNGFQALMADAAKHAVRKVTRECFLDRNSPLFGTRPIAFIHDELIAEMPLEVAHLAGPRMAEVMVSAAREYVPDVTMKAEAALSYYWSKAAGEPVYRDGKLIPWEDREEVKHAA